MKSQQIFTIIPAYNPGEIIKEVVTQALKFVENIIIVDDGCDAFNKNIIQELKNENVAVLTHKENQGKGFALHTGVEYALTNNADTIIMLDSDGQHSPSELPKFIEFSKKNDFQLVLGVRTEIEKMPLRSKIGNVLMVKVFNLIYRQSLKETQSGFRMISKDFAKLFLANVEAGRYETEMKMLILAAKEKMKIEQIPIQTKYIDGNSNSKFRPITDSLRVLGSFSKYSGVGFLSFLIDYGLFLTFTYIFGLFFLTAHLFSRLCSGLFNFYANRKFVFVHKQSVKTSFLKYIVAVVLSIGISSTLLVLFVDVFSTQVPIAKVIAESCTFLVNYLVLKHFVFKVK